MDFITYIRKPFSVEAVEVTKENMAEIAEMIGQVREDGKGNSYIFVDRRLVPNINITRVYIGFYVTRLGDNIRCYSRKEFHQQFVESTQDIEDWIRFLNGGPKVGFDH